MSRWQAEALGQGGAGLAALPAGAADAGVASSTSSWPAWRRARHVLWLGPHDPAGRFAEWCAAHTGSGCDVLLSAQLVHTLLLADVGAGAQPLHIHMQPDEKQNLPHLPVRAELVEASAQHTLHALQAQARAHWARFHGAGAMAWPVAIGDAAGATVACAPCGFDLAELRATARRHRVALRSVQPAWAAAWAGGVKARESLRLAVFEPGAVMWIAIAAGRCKALARQAVDDADLRDEARVQALLQQAPLPISDAPWRLFGHGAAGLAAAAPLTPARAGRAVPLPDFVADQSGAAWPAWALLGAAAAVLASSALDSRALAERVDAQHERMAAIERATASRRGAALQAAGMPRVNAAGNGAANANGGGSGSGNAIGNANADADAARAAQLVTRRLQHRWPQLFGALEQAAGERVRMLAISHEIASGTVRVEGIAADADALGGFVSTLAAAPELGEVVLRSQQAQRDAGTAPGLRFDISAVLR